MKIRPNTISDDKLPTELFVPQEKIEKLEEDKKRRLQLYVFVSRCVAHPFNAKQPTDMTRRHTKLTPHQLETIQARFQVSSSLMINGFPVGKTRSCEASMSWQMQHRRRYTRLSNYKR